MSVFVKGGGGGKSEGLYVWGKYSAVIDIGSTVSDIALVNDGTYVYLYTKDQLYIEDGTIKIYQDAPLLMEISSVIEAEMIGGTPLYCMGIDGNVYYCPLPNNSGSVDSCMANLVVVNKGDFIDFVVSDNESKYPDGGTHTDGYWYEKFDISESPLIDGGFTQFATGIVTISSTTTKITIPHNMGVKPKRLLIMRIDNPDTTLNVVKMLVQLQEEDGTIINRLGGIFYDTGTHYGFASQNSSLSVSTSQTVITLGQAYKCSGGSVSTLKFISGDYQWLAFR